MSRERRRERNGCESGTRRRSRRWAPRAGPKSTLAVGSCPAVACCSRFGKARPSVDPCIVRQRAYRDAKASALDEPWFERRGCHVHAVDLAGRPEPDAAELQHGWRLSFNGWRQALGIDPLPATDQFDECAPRVASDQCQRRLCGRGLARTTEDVAGSGEDLERGARRPLGRELNRNRPGTTGVDAGRRSARHLPLDRRWEELAGRWSSPRAAAGLPLRSDEPGRETHLFLGHRSGRSPL